MYQDPLILPSDDPGYFPSLQLHSQDIHLRMNYEEMRRDCHVLSTLNKLNNAITGRQILVEKFSDNPKDKKNEEIAKKILSKINYSQICKDLLDAHYIGVSFLCVKEWVNDDSVLYPNLVSIPWWRFIFVPVNNNTNSKEIPIYKSDRVKTKKNKIATYMGYEVRILTKRRPVTGERLLDGDVIVYSFGSSYYPYGLGLAWRFYPWWIIKNAARDNIIRTVGRKGSPPVVAEHPQELSEKDPRYIKWTNFLKYISPNGYFTGAPGYKASNVFAPEDSSDPQYLIDLSAQEISKAALSEVPYSATDHGSYSAQVSQNTDRETNVIDAHCILLNECLTKIWEKIKKYNYPGSNSPNIRIWTTNEDIKKEIEKRRKDEDRLEEENKRIREKHEIEILKQKADLWNVMINQVGLTPDPSLVEKTFGKGWSFQKQDDIFSQLSKGEGQENINNGNNEELIPNKPQDEIVKDVGEQKDKDKQQNQELTM